MASNFFTNQGENTLYKKFVGVFEHMQNIEYFKSVIGYFRASGYFAIRKHFPDDLKVKIIAGINVDPDDILRLREAIQLYVSMDQEEMGKWSTSAHEYAEKAINVEEIGRGYRVMFTLESHLFK